MGWAEVAGYAQSSGGEAPHVMGDVILYLCQKVAVGCSFTAANLDKFGFFLAYFSENMIYEYMKILIV